MSNVLKIVCGMQEVVLYKLVDYENIKFVPNCVQKITVSKFCNIRQQYLCRREQDKCRLYQNKTKKEQGLVRQAIHVPQLKLKATD